MAQEKAYPSFATLLNDENALWMSSRLVVAAICVVNAVIQWRHVRGEYSTEDLDHIFTVYNYLGGISVTIGLVLLMSGMQFGVIPLLVGSKAFAQELILIHVQPVDKKRIAAIAWTGLASILGLVVVFKAYEYHVQTSSSSVIAS